jgi:hypothetical protein
MNRQLTVYRRLTTSEPPEVVFNAVEQSLRSTVGGSVERHGNTFLVRNGTANVNFSFMADVYAEVSLTQPVPGIVDVQGTITLTPNTFFWIMAVTGAFCLWFLWGFNILYFVMDPRPTYQSALDRVRFDDPSALGDPAYRS